MVLNCTAFINITTCDISLHEVNRLQVGRRRKRSWLLARATEFKSVVICIYCHKISIVQINHQPDETIFQFIILTFIYSSTCFGRFPAHQQELNDCSGSLWFYLRIVVTVVLSSRYEDKNQRLPLQSLSS
jgi:hypothetical protein